MTKINVPFTTGGRDYTIEAIVFPTTITENSANLGAFTVDANEPPRFVIKKDTEALLKELAEKGLAKEDYIYLPHWKEPVLFLKKSMGEELPLNIEFSAGSSYRAQALRKGYSARPIMQSGAIIFALARDERIVYGGVRGGNDRIGEVAPVGGSVDYNQRKRHPLFKAITSETQEELGFFPENLSIIGHFVEPSYYLSDTAVFIGEIAGSSREVDELHKMAFQIYTSEKRRGLPEIEARNAIKKAGLPNVDAWEHKGLVTTPYSREHIERTRETCEKQGIFGPIAIGSTAVILEYLK